MKILLLGNYAPDRQYSMQGFADALVAGLRERGQEVRLVAPRARLGRIRSPAALGKWLGYADKFVLFPPDLRREMRWADIVHVCDQGNGMYVPLLQSVPHLVTCHDLLAIRAAHGELTGWPTGASGRLYQQLILRGLKQTRHMVCDSEATRQDILRLTDLTAACVQLVYLCLLQPYQSIPEAESEPLLTPLGLPPSTRFLLHVGGNQPYKNRPMTLQIFLALRDAGNAEGLKLVLAGKPLPSAMRDEIARHGLADQIFERSDVGRETLRALYSRAAGLVFPSLYEGFGLPIIEAQACGCPVFTSNRAPLTELGGDAAAYFDPTQPAEAAQVIAAGLADRDRMVKAGLENVRRFSGSRMVDNYIQAYESVLNGSFCANKS